VRVLLVGINFSPEQTGIGPYMRAYADALHGTGHIVTVLTGVPHYPEWRRRPVGVESSPYEVIRCDHFVPRRPSVVGRLRYEATFALAVRRRLNDIGGQDAALAVIPALASTAVTAAWADRRSVPFLVMVQDIATSAASLLGPVGAIVGSAGLLLERQILRRSVAVAAVTNEMRLTLVSHGARPDRIHVVPNWPLREPLDLDPAIAREASGYPPHDIVCVHAGNMGAKQGLEVVVDAARLAESRGARVHFVLVGDGNQRSILESRALGLSRIEFRPLLAQPEYDGALSGADILLVTQRSSVRDMAFPSKLTSYLGAGRPVVASVGRESATAIELSRAGCAVVVPPDDPEALLSAVLRIGSDPALAAELVRAARAFYLRELDAVALRSRFVRFVEDAVSAG
jgi:putative colanic acid biosynthesis glycosyltransferase WcaI